MSLYYHSSIIKLIVFCRDTSTPNGDQQTVGRKLPLADVGIRVIGNAAYE